MKKVIFSFVLLFCLSQSNAFSAIQITSETDLLKLMNQVSPFDDWSADYELTTDLDMTGYTISSVPYPTNPIGNGATDFTGTFEGNSYNINNLSILKPKINDAANYNVGLFGSIGTGGSVSNLGVSNASISGFMNVGVFCGGNEGSIYNCNSSGSVTNSLEYIGGFTGYNLNGSISRCYSSASVNAEGNYVGGFCGSNDEGTINHCHSTGDVTCNGRGGGFCGENADGLIIYCYSTGNVTGMQSLGGFCGYNFKFGGSGVSTISFCYSTGNATSNVPNEEGGVDIGGFCSVSSGTINNCYSTGNAYGYSIIGGFCAELWYLGTGIYLGTITNCFSIGVPSASGSGRIVGGFIGYETDGNTGIYECNFWGFQNANLDDIGNKGDNANITELPIEEFADQSNFQCLDFNNVWMMRGSHPVLTELTIPTLTEWAVSIFIGLLAIFGGWFLWRRMV